MTLTIACRTMLQTERTGIPGYEEKHYPTHGTRVAVASRWCCLCTSTQFLYSFHSVYLWCRSNHPSPCTVLAAGAPLCSIRELIFKENTSNDSDKTGKLNKRRSKSLMPRLKAAPLTVRSRAERSPGTRNNHSKKNSPASPLGPSPETRSAYTCGCNDHNAADRTKELRWDFCLCVSLIIRI